MTSILSVFTVTAMTMLPLPPAGVMYSDTACQKDYLIIAGGSQTGFGPVSMFFAKDRYCGITLGKLNQGTRAKLSAFLILHR